MEASGEPTRADFSHLSTQDRDSYVSGHSQNLRLTDNL